jgi:hypothetical protein
MIDKEKLTQALKNGECVDAEGNSLFIEKTNGDSEPLNILLSDVSIDHFGNVYLKHDYVGVKANIELADAIFENPISPAEKSGDGKKKSEPKPCSKYQEILEALRSVEADLAYSYLNAEKKNPKGTDAQGIISARKDGSLVFIPKSNPKQTIEIENVGTQIDADVDGTAFYEGKSASFEDEAAIKAAIVKISFAVAIKLAEASSLDPNNDYWKKLGVITNDLTLYSQLIIRLNEAKKALFGQKEQKEQ